MTRYRRVGADDREIAFDDAAPPRSKRRFRGNTIRISQEEKRSPTPSTASKPSGTSEMSILSGSTRTRFVRTADARPYRGSEVRCCSIRRSRSARDVEVADPVPLRSWRYSRHRHPLRCHVIRSLIAASSVGNRRAPPHTRSKNAISMQRIPLSAKRSTNTLRQRTHAVRLQSHPYFSRTLRVDPWGNHTIT